MSYVTVTAAALTVADRVAIVTSEVVYAVAGTVRGGMGYLDEQ